MIDEAKWRHQAMAIGFEQSAVVEDLLVADNCRVTLDTGERGIVIETADGTMTCEVSFVVTFVARASKDQQYFEAR